MDDEEEELEAVIAVEEELKPLPCLRVLCPKEDEVEQEGVQEHVVPGPEGRPQCAQQRDTGTCCS